MPNSDSASIEVVPTDTPCQPKNKATFISQIIIICVIIVVSLINLCLQRPDRELWLMLLSSSLGYILPSPALKFNKNKT